MIRSRLRFLGAAILGLAVALPSNATAQEEAGRRLQIVLTEITPQIPTGADPIQIAGYVQSPADDDLDDLSVSLRVTSLPFLGREQLESYAAGRSDRAHQDVEGVHADLGAIGPDELAPFRLEAGVDAFALNGRGVYGVEVTASSGAEVSTVHTFLTWMPESQPVNPIQVVWLLPVVDRPSQDRAGRFVDDHLARSLAPGGRLGGILDAAQGREVTWVIDPDLISSAEAMASGYRLADGAAGSGAEAAARWLAKLRQAASTGEVLTLPYADVDLAALVRDEHTAVAAAAAQRGAAETARILGVTPTSDVAWPAAGFADQTLLAALPDTGHRSVILDGTAVPLASDVPLTYTPTGRADLTTDSGTISAALADPALVDILRRDTRQPGVGALVVQRMLAETAWIALEQPNRQRAILIQPPRRWNPDPTVADQLLTGFSEAAWIEPIGVTELLDTEPSEERRAGPVFPADARATELPTSHIRAVSRLGERVSDFATVLSDPETLTAGYSNALLRAQSTAWADGDGGVTEAGRIYLSSLRRDLNTQVDKIRIISHGTVTLSSNSGTVPVTIANDLDQPVQVRLSLKPRVASRLTVDEPQPVVIEPDARQTVEVAASAVASGITTIDAQLLTIAGDPIGSPTQFNVRATNFGVVGFVVIGGALVLLVISAAIRIIRRTVKKRARRAARAAALTERVKA